ncbi:hypothetical protein [Roseomonas elaeocarpi]|uniref:Uncharacterized protein n=1 Tax=Roseomonas elaeocarpi TaxID=907779 RepID=A0ABV6JZX9_9PROT
MSGALQAALRDPRVAARFAELGTTSVDTAMATPAAHKSYWMADLAKWCPIIEGAGQYAD